MDMFNKHPDIVRENAIQKIDALHEDAVNEAFAQAHRLRFKKQVSRKIATYLRKLANRLEPQIIPQTQSNPLNQNLKRQVG